jgi:hypothetical protein
MIKALPDVKEDGNSLLFDGDWEVTVHAGRDGGVMSVQQVTRVTLESEFAVLETYKNQRVVVVLDQIRGLAAEPTPGDRKGRKTGFV